MAVTAIFGVGKLGGALLSGLLGSGVAPSALRMVDPGRHADALSQSTGVPSVAAQEAVQGAELLVIAVKPVDVAALLSGLAPAVRPGEQLVVSVAAGITTQAIASHLPAGTPVVRAMPNTPLLVGEGMTGLSAGATATEGHLLAAEALFAPVSRVMRFREEQLDAVTALSGSGPAYFFLAMEALADAGVLLGLPRPVALELVTQTALGAAAMVRAGVDTPAQLREAVSSPAGTSIAGIRALEDRGFRAALMAAAEAARDRSRELSAELA